MAYRRSLRECIKRVAIVVWSALPTIILIISHVMLFSWIGYLFFQGIYIIYIIYIYIYIYI